MGRIYYDVYAIKLTEDNIPEILEATEPLGWTLSLWDNMEFNREEDGCDTILFMKLYKDTIEIATFVDEPWDEDNSKIRLTNHLDPKFGIFYKIEN